MSSDEELDAIWYLYTKPLCKPAIESRQQYERLTEAGQLRAAEYLKQVPHPLRSETTLLDTHWEIFRDVYDWAGSFRERQNIVGFGEQVGPDPTDKEFSGAYAPMICSELETLKGQLQKLLHRDADLEQKAQAIAFYSTKLHLIHPFRDGNSRVSMALTRLLAGKLLVSIKPPTPEVGLYRQVRTLAQREAFLRPFAQHVLGVRLPERLSHAPHPMTMSPHLVTKRLDNGLYASVVCGDAKDTRRWQSTLESLKASGELDSVRDGEEQLVRPVNKSGQSPSRSAQGERPVLIHKDVDDRERLREQELTQQRQGPRLKM